MTLKLAQKIIKKIKVPTTLNRPVLKVKQLEYYGKSNQIKTFEYIIKKKRKKYLVHTLNNINSYYTANC